jgi:hypothetical protein
MVRGLSLLGFLNFFILQWFFIRLTYIKSKTEKNRYVVKFEIPLTKWNYYNYTRPERYYRRW